MVARVVRYSRQVPDGQSRQCIKDRLARVVGKRIDSVYYVKGRTPYDILCTQLCLPLPGVLPNTSYWFIRGRLASTLKQFPAYCRAAVALSWRLW